jgi:hypothetical protein
MDILIPVKWLKIWFGISKELNYALFHYL